MTLVAWDHGTLAGARFLVAHVVVGSPVEIAVGPSGKRILSGFATISCSMIVEGKLRL